MPRDQKIIERMRFRCETHVERNFFMPITPNTLDDFMKLFGGGSAADEQQAAQYHERFVSTNPEDNQFDNSTYHEAVAEHLSAVPEDQFHAAAKNAIAQTPPEQRQDLL